MCPLCFDVTDVVLLCCDVRPESIAVVLNHRDDVGFAKPELSALGGSLPGLWSEKLGSDWLFFVRIRPRVGKGKMLDDRLLQVSWLFIIILREKSSIVFSK